VSPKKKLEKVLPHPDIILCKTMHRTRGSASPLWSTSIGEKGRTLGKTYWIKARCYWEHPWGTHWEPGEHIENLMGKPLGTRREHVGNKGKNGEKKNSES